MVSLSSAGPSCSHIRKGIDHSFLKKTGEDSNWNTCQDCKDEEHTATEAQSDENGEERESPTIWVCLKCGHRVSYGYMELQIYFYGHCYLLT